MNAPAVALRGSSREPKPDKHARKSAVPPNGEDRLRMIAEEAYYRAERRGFTPGRELDDWLAAEIEVDALLGGDER